MIVKIIGYGSDEINFVEYMVLQLTPEQLNFLNDSLDEETSIDEDNLIIKMYFDDGLYPFQSEVAKFRLDDFISREEIEMTVYLASFLEDM